MRIKFTHKVLFILVFMITLPVAGCAFFSSSQQVNNNGQIKLIPATVTGVIDGDTAYVTLPDGEEEKVRFIGIDTPESTREVEPYGKKASNYTKSKLEGEKVFLETDVEERDEYGRLLAYIWREKPVKFSEEEIKDKMFNAELLLEGYAHLMTVPPNVKYVDYLKKYQNMAREENRGLWDLRNQETEEYYIGSKNSNKFHRPSCKWGKQIKRNNLIKFDNKDEAYERDYEPCNACNP